MATSKPSDKAPTKTRKIIDVTEPGKSAPSPSARPIIVSNRPVLKRDPMMLTPDGMEKDADDGTSTTVLPHSSASKTIKIMPLSPLSSGKPEDTATPPGGTPASAKELRNQMAAPTPSTSAPAKSAEQKAAAKDLGIEAVTNIDRAEEPVAPKPVAVAGEEKDIKPDDEEPLKKPEDTAKDSPTEPDDEESPAVPDAKPDSKEDAAKEEEPTPPLPAAQTSVPDEEKDIDGDVDGQLAPNQSIDQAKRKAEDEKLAKLAEQEKVIDSKQYYLPINSVEHRRRSLDRTIFILMLVLVLALVWLDIVMDAGILKVGGIQPLTHFFAP